MAQFKSFVKKQTTTATVGSLKAKLGFCPSPEFEAFMPVLPPSCEIVLVPRRYIGVPEPLDALLQHPTFTLSPSSKSTKPAFVALVKRLGLHFLAHAPSWHASGEKPGVFLLLLDEDEFALAFSITTPHKLVGLVVPILAPTSVLRARSYLNPQGLMRAPKIRKIRKIKKRRSSKHRSSASAVDESAALAEADVKPMPVVQAPQGPGDPTTVLGPAQDATFVPPQASAGHPGVVLKKRKTRKRKRRSSHKDGSSFADTDVDAQAETGGAVDDDAPETATETTTAVVDPPAVAGIGSDPTIGIRRVKRQRLTPRKYLDPDVVLESSVGMGTPPPATSFKRTSSGGPRVKKTKKTSKKKADPKLFAGGRRGRRRTVHRFTHEMKGLLIRKCARMLMVEPGLRWTMQVCKALVAEAKTLDPSFPLTPKLMTNFARNNMKFIQPLINAVQAGTMQVDDYVHVPQSRGRKKDATEAK